MWVVTAPVKRLSLWGQHSQRSPFLSSQATVCAVVFVGLSEPLTHRPVFVVARAAGGAFPFIFQVEAIRR